MAKSIKGRHSGLEPLPDRDAGAAQLMSARFQRRFLSTDVSFAENEFQDALSFIERWENYLEYFRGIGSLSQPGPGTFVWHGELAEGIKFVSGWRKWVWSNRSRLLTSVEAFARYAPPFEKNHLGRALDNKSYNFGTPAHLSSLSARYHDMFRRLQELDKNVNIVMKAVYANQIQRQPSNISMVSQFADSSSREPSDSVRRGLKDQGDDQIDKKSSENSGGASGTSKEGYYKGLGRDSQSGVGPQGSKTQGDGPAAQSRPATPRRGSFNRIFSRGAAQTAAQFAKGPEQAGQSGRPEQPEQKTGRRESPNSIFRRGRQEQPGDSSGSATQEQIVPRRRRGSISSLLSQGLKLASEAPGLGKASRQRE